MPPAVAKPLRHTVPGSALVPFCSIAKLGLVCAAQGSITSNPKNTAYRGDSHVEENKYRKMREAQYFLGGMVATEPDCEEFVHNLSAFLSAARSIIQYAYANVKDDPRAKRWYDSECGLFRSLKFFKGKRDMNIHTEPVTVARTVVQQADEVIQLSDHLVVTVTDENGHVIVRREAGTGPEAGLLKPPSAPPEYRHYFDDWPLAEDAVTLCTYYLQDIVGMVREGEAKGLLPL